MTGEQSEMLNTFVDTEYPRVVAAVSLLSGNRDDAADAVQDALVGYLAKPPKQQITNLAAWITVVAGNHVKQLQRRNSAQRRAYEKLHSQLESAEAFPIPNAASSLGAEVKRALLLLPPKQREICVLHYLFDLSVDQIAATLSISGGTVKTQLFRARQSLAKTLQPEVKHV